MAPWPALGRREGRLLATLVSEYISTGEPVGSRTLARRSGLGVSSATVRSTMAALEDKGFVWQPHTSAGRLPTDLGLRVFVEALMEVRALTATDRGMIRERIGGMPPHERWQETGRLLSELTAQASIVLVPKPEAMVLAQLRFVPLTSGEIVALLVSASGAVHHRVFRVAAVPPADRLERIHNYLNELVPGRTLAESRQRIEEEMRASKRTLDAMQIEALGLGRDALGRVADEASVVVQGQARLVVGLAGVERDRIGKLMDLLEEQHALVDLLDATIRAEPRTILIGTEHPVTAGAECSLVAVACRPGQGGVGTLAVIGPRSMDYCMVLPLVEYAAEVISATSGLAA